MEKAKYIGLHKIKGPECIVFDKEGHLYTGLVNGSIIKIDKHDRKIMKVLAHMGEETNQTICSRFFNFQKNSNVVLFYKNVFC